MLLSQKAFTKWKKNISVLCPHRNFWLSVRHSTEALVATLKVSEWTLIRRFDMSWWTQIHLFQRFGRLAWDQNSQAFAFEFGCNKVFVAWPPRNYVLFWHVYINIYSPFWHMLSWVSPTAVGSPLLLNLLTTQAGLGIDKTRLHDMTIWDTFSSLSFRHGEVTPISGQPPIAPGAETVVTCGMSISPDISRLVSTECKIFLWKVCQALQCFLVRSSIGKSESLQSLAELGRLWCRTMGRQLSDLQVAVGLNSISIDFGYFMIFRYLNWTNFGISGFRYFDIWLDENQVAEMEELELPRTRKSKCCAGLRRQTMIKHLIKHDKTQTLSPSGSLTLGLHPDACKTLEVKCSRYSARNFQNWALTNPCVANLCCFFWSTVSATLQLAQLAVISLPFASPGCYNTSMLSG